MKWNAGTRGAIAAAAAVLAGCLAPSFAAAVSPATGPVPESEAGATATPPMWRVADENSEIWLLGTFHILPPGLDWRPDYLVAAADAADVLWFEAEVDTPASTQRAQQIVRENGLLTGGQKLSAALETDDAARLAAVAAELGMPMQSGPNGEPGVDAMRPWLAFLSFSIGFIVEQGFDPGSGVETVLLKEGRARGKELRFFESIEQQLGLFTSLPPYTEKNLLVLTLRDWERQKEDFDNLFEAWRAGDAEAIDSLMNVPMRESAAEVYDALVENRNEAWAGQIAGAMAGSGKILVAVGAGHLVGEDSVPALLEAKGFTVERYGVAPAAE